jgi:hypothetical protein
MDVGGHGIQLARISAQIQVLGTQTASLAVVYAAIRHLEYAVLARHDP